jgi:hypothetical protein
MAIGSLLMGIGNRLAIGFPSFTFLSLSLSLSLSLFQRPMMPPGCSSSLLLLLLLLHIDYFGSFRDGIRILNIKYYLNFPFGSF